MLIWSGKAREVLLFQVASEREKAVIGPYILSYIWKMAMSLECDYIVASSAYLSPHLPSHTHTYTLALCTHAHTHTHSTYVHTHPCTHTHTPPPSHTHTCTQSPTKPTKVMGGSKPSLYKVSLPLVQEAGQRGSV